LAGRRSLTKIWEMEYRHTQWGYFAALTVVVLVPVVAAVTADGDPWAGAMVALVALLIAAVVLWFSRLTVTVEGGYVRAEFGMGKPRKSIDLDGVTAVRQVRNHWYYGFGIRKVPNGWMYNVSGLDAVELHLTSGKVFRIGTDDVDQLFGVLSIQINR